MFEFFVIVYNLLPGHGYSLTIIIFSVLVLGLLFVLVFEEIRLRKIIKDLESKLQLLQKNYQPDNAVSHKESALQQGLHKFDVGVMPPEKKDSLADLLKESDSAVEIENIQKEVYDNAIPKETQKVSDQKTDALTQEGDSKSEFLKKSEISSQNIPPAPIITSSLNKEDGLSASQKPTNKDISGPLILHKPYAKLQAPVSPVAAESPAEAALRAPYGPKKRDVNPGAPTPQIPPAQKFSPTSSAGGIDSVSRYQVKKEFMKIRDRTRTGIGRTHIVNRPEKRRMADDLLPEMVTGKKIETKEIEKKIKTLEHEKFIARKFKEGKYERSRIQDSIDYLKGVEKHLFGKK